MKEQLNGIIPKTTTATYGPWTLNMHSHALGMSPEEIAALSEYAGRWVKVFPQEPRTLAKEAFGVPSALIRFDYVVENGQVRVYEIEDRPAFLVLGSLVNPCFGHGLRTLVRKWRDHLQRPIAIYVTEWRHGNSDDLLHPMLEDPIFDYVSDTLSNIPPDAALIVRSEYTKRECFCLEPRSIATISEEGWKGYGVPLGLWHDIDALTFDFNAGAFILKPAYGCRTENMLMYHPDSAVRNRKNSGFSTWEAAIRAVDSRTAKYAQTYYAPEKHDFLGSQYNLIRRVHFGYDPETAGYICLGGIWMARTTALVHGASDTITGQINP